MQRILFFLLLLPLFSFANDKRVKVRFETTAGPFTVVLFNDTPLHRDNFLKLVNDGYYNGTKFHRVIANFMVQGGDPQTRNEAAATQEIGEGGPDYTLPAEIFPTGDAGHPKRPLHYHVRGALAMAREGDDVNPERRSAGSQFYIVWGTTFTPENLMKRWQRVQQAVGDSVALPDSVRDLYYFTGGTPHLDGQYTVFGEIFSGLPVIEDIQAVSTNPENNRPLDDIMIIRAYVKE